MIAIQRIPQEQSFPLALRPVDPSHNALPLVTGDYHKAEAIFRTTGILAENSPRIGTNTWCCLVTAKISATIQHTAFVPHFRRLSRNVAISKESLRRDLHERRAA
jgi:hypothetical protein